MKKIISLIVIILTITLITGCGSKSNKTKEVDINDTQKQSIGALLFEIPKAYEKSSQSSEDMYFYDIEDLDYDLSSISLLFSTSEKYTDNQLADDIKFEFSEKYFEKPTEKKKTIDGHEWTFVEAKSKPTDNDNYYLEGVYIIEHKDNIYKFKYTNYTPEYNSGNKLIEKIVNSFKLG